MKKVINVVKKAAKWYFEQSSLLASCRLTDVFKKEKMASRMLF